MLEPFDHYVGPAAGLFTSVLWTGTSMCFTAASRRIGATLVNTLRICLAVVLLGVTHRMWTGMWVPNAVGGQITLLALSGVVGLAIGDQALFTAFVDIGPRIAMLIMATAPILAAVFGFAALGERLGALSCVGMAMTIGGIAWVVLERPSGDFAADRRHRARGLILAVVASACQAGGLLLSKQGLGHGWLPREQHLDPQAATFIRMTFAALAAVPILLLHRLRLRNRAPVDAKSPRAGTIKSGLLLTLCGSMVGPYLGVWMSLVASDRAPLGVAQTLCSLPPVFILPFARFVYGEHIGARAVVGAIVAVGGTAVLFLAP